MKKFLYSNWWTSEQVDEWTASRQSFCDFRQSFCAIRQRFCDFRQKLCFFFKKSCIVSKYHLSLPPRSMIQLFIIHN